MKRFSVPLLTMIRSSSGVSLLYLYSTAPFSPFAAATATATTNPPSQIHTTFTLRHLHDFPTLQVQNHQFCIHDRLAIYEMLFLTKSFHPFLSSATRTLWHQRAAGARRVPGAPG